MALAHIQLAQAAIVSIAHGVFGRPASQAKSWPIDGRSGMQTARLTARIASYGFLQALQQLIPLPVNPDKGAVCDHVRVPMRADNELATLQWVHWFNHTRLLKPIGGIPAAEAESNYWRHSPVIAAQATST